MEIKGLVTSCGKIYVPEPRSMENSPGADFPGSFYRAA